MIGRSSSLQQLIDYLKGLQINYKTYSFVQGHVCRWFIVWTFLQTIKFHWLIELQNNYWNLKLKYLRCCIVQYLYVYNFNFWLHHYTRAFLMKIYNGFCRDVSEASTLSSESCIFFKQNDRWDIAHQLLIVLVWVWVNYRLG